MRTMAMCRVEDRKCPAALESDGVGRANIMSVKREMKQNIFSSPHKKKNLQENIYPKLHQITLFSHFQIFRHCLSTNFSHNEIVERIFRAIM